MKQDIFEVALDSVCSCCEHVMKPSDKAIYVVRYPIGKADVLCVACWMAIIVSSSAWLTSGGDTSTEGVRERLAEAVEAAETRQRSNYWFDQFLSN